MAWLTSAILSEYLLIVGRLLNFPKSQVVNLKYVLSLKSHKKKNKIKCLFIFPCELRLHKADLEFSGDRFNVEKQLVSDNHNRPLPSFLIMWNFSTHAEVAGWILRPLRSTCQCKLTNCQSL